MSTTLDWANLLLRWLHLGFGIAWIGTSFYFVWLDRNLWTPQAGRQDVEGEIWMVHSGGFYQVLKRRVGPGELPAVLHWFKWEAALTWITGMLLLVVVYYLTDAYLIDPTVSAMTSGRAAVLTVTLLIASWVAYDWLWKSPLGQFGWLATALSLGLLSGVVFGLCRVLSGRAAYIHVGAVLGTIMVANVWVRILPAQQAMIDTTREGRPPDLSLGTAAKRRSLHNSYMTFPVLFIMLSSHFPAVHGHDSNWLGLALLVGAGIAARHVMIGGTVARYWATLPLAACFAGAIALTSHPSAGSAQHQAARARSPVSFGRARVVINQRCLPCHSQYPTDDTFRVAPTGVKFDTPDEIDRYADRILERAVVQGTMPLFNKTGITPQEREVLRRWVEGGARLE